MKKLKLTISPEYVKSWGTWEALRELIQNAIDREEECKNEEIQDGKMIFKYYKDKEVLVIGSRDTTIKLGSLILGQTTKKNNHITIGQFGEGYKLALLVLLRLGLKVRVLNGNQRWVPGFEYDDTFETDLLTIKVYEDKTDTNGLKFFVSGIDENAYSELKEKWLYLQKFQSQETTHGDILTEEKQRGRIYVNGLYVCTVDTKKFFKGYNFKPDVIKLDRDRKAVSSFDLSWAAKEMIGSLDDDIIIDLTKQNADDLEYFWSEYGPVEKTSEIAGKIFADFVSHHGENAVPCESMDEYMQMEQKYEDCHPVNVGAVMAHACQVAEGYPKLILRLRERKVIKPEAHCRAFYDTYEDLFPEILKEKYLDEIVTRAENWKEL